MCTTCHCWCTCQAVVLLILTVVQNPGLLFGLTKCLCTTVKKQILLTVIIFVVAAMCHFGCCGRWLSSSCQLLVFFHQPHFQNNKSWKLVLACSGLLVSIGCGWNLLPELEAITGWIWASERLLWKGKWTISRLNSLLKWHAFFSAAILLVGTLNSCIRSMGMIINAELRIQILPFLLHLSILSFEENTGYFM